MIFLLLRMPQHLHNRWLLDAALHDLGTGSALIDVVDHATLCAGVEAVIIPHTGVTTRSRSRTPIGQYIQRILISCHSCFGQISHLFADFTLHGATKAEKQQHLSQIVGEHGKKLILAITAPTCN